MNCFCYFSILLLFILIKNGDCTIPDYIHVCHRDNRNLSNCIIDSIEFLRPLLKVGIPDIQAPTLEPLSVERLAIKSLGGAGSLTTNLTNVKAFGASDFQIVSLTPILHKSGYTFKFEIFVPRLHIEGNYAVDAKILLLQISGNGPFTANITNYNCSCVLKGKKIQKESDTHLYFEQMRCTFTIGKAEIHLHNLFNGNEILEKATNDVINDNSNLFFEPNLLDTLEKSFTNTANKITLNFKYEELFP